MVADPYSLMSLLTGHWVSQSVYAAVQTGIFDQLDGQPRGPDEVAKKTGCDQDAVFRLLRFLADIGLLDRHENDQYTATDTARLLQRNGCFHDLALMYCGDLYQAWGQFSETIRTGKNAFEHTYEAGRFDYLAGNPDIARRFDRAMAAVTDLIGGELADSLNFARASRIFDIGGGNGSLLKKILHATPTASGVVVDRRHVVEQCLREPADQEIADRLSVQEADFFEAVPAGGDIYILARVLHDWDDQSCARILRVCRQAMIPGTELVILERLLPQDGTASLASIWDLHMLAITGGRERTRTQYAELLSSAGFRLDNTRSLTLDMFALVASAT